MKKTKKKTKRSPATVAPAPASKPREDAIREADRYRELRASARSRQRHGWRWQFGLL
jgi:hypothetical protein